MTTEIADSVKTLISRMETHPEEFYGEAHKWKFIFKEKFREALSEAEKGAIHDALRNVRRQEFGAEVISALVHTEANENYDIYKNTVITSSNSAQNTMSWPAQQELVKYARLDRYKSVSDK